ncbi:hypothetical protein DCD74_06275 [Lysobacter oculi]|uniref:DUF2231 domain-containing protein n=1 Tax=Solilutibacter oculi TaxID=2698682 RepID=A0A344J5N8_9GAMM|nr:DUF2231 domain-containing protein [Lysobacter oculi]AXA84348.1 hypothetical protein DCD74_06275 [Lysobacter oculi]
MEGRHPLHPALVHFPVACWSLGTLADFASLHFGGDAARLCGVLLLAGTGIALPAAAAGLYEFTRIPAGSPAMRTAWIHMGAMLTAFVLYASSLLLRVNHLHEPQVGAWPLALDVAGFIALTVGGWQGGRLVYHHGTGTRAPCD